MLINIDTKMGFGSNIHEAMVQENCPKSLKEQKMFIKVSSSL